MPRTIRTPLHRNNLILEECLINRMALVATLKKSEEENKLVLDV